MDGKIRGRVVDAAGNGVPEASVMMIRAPGPVPDIAAVSNADGRFVFSGLSSGTYRLKAIGPNGDVGEADAMVLKTGEAREVAIHLRRSAD